MQSADSQWKADWTQWGGGWEEDNKATGEGHKAMEIVSGIAEWRVKRHEKGGVRRVGAEEGEKKWEGLGGK